jgi:hypothetical protein
MLHATYQNLAAYATAATGNVTVVAMDGGKSKPKTMRVLPVTDAGLDDKSSSSSSSSLSLLALGGRHLAVGFQGNKDILCLYDLNSSSTQAVIDLKYPAEVLQLCLNQQYAAVLLATSPPQVVLHALKDEAPLRGQKKFPLVLGLNRPRLEQWFGIGKCLFPSCGEIHKRRVFHVLIFSSQMTATKEPCSPASP